MIVKKAYILAILQFLFSYAYSLNVTIIESQSDNGGHVMDKNWQSVVSGMGHSAHGYSNGLR
jgi:hypothetical protein